MFRIFWIKSSLFSIDFQKSINLNFEKILNLRIFDNKKKSTIVTSNVFADEKILSKIIILICDRFFSIFDASTIDASNMKIFFSSKFSYFFAIFFLFFAIFFHFFERRILKIDNFFFDFFIQNAFFYYFDRFFIFFVNVLRSNDKQNDNIHINMIHDDNFEIVFFIRKQFFYSFAFYVDRVDVFFCRCSRFKIELRNDQKRDLKNRTRLNENRRWWKNHFIEFFRNYYTIALIAFNSHAYIKRFIALKF